LDVSAIDGAFSVIEQQARRAEQQYSRVLDVCYEFLEAGEDERNDDGKSAPAVAAVPSPPVARDHSSRKRR
jgi:hypothetical protein